MTEEEWMVEQDRQFVLSSFVGMSKRWRFRPEPRVVPVVSVDRQLEIAVRVLDAKGARLGDERKAA